MGIEITSKVLVGDGNFTPADYGLIGMNGEFTTGLSNFTLQSARPDFMKIRLMAPSVCTGVWMPIMTGGVALTSGQNLSALYDTSGNRLAISADQTTEWTTTGNKDIPWIGGPLNLAAGDYFVGTLSVGTTPPQTMRRANSVTANGRRTGPMQSLRCIRSTTGGYTTLPTTLNMTTDVVPAGTLWFVGLY